MNPPKKRENTITRYRLVEEHLIGEAVEPVRNYDLLSIIMLCLGGPDGGNYEGVLRMLDVLLSSETGEAEKRKILQDDYDEQVPLFEHFYRKAGLVMFGKPCNMGLSSILY